MINSHPQSLKLCSNEQLNTQTAKYPSAAGTKIRPRPHEDDCKRKR